MNTFISTLYANQDLNSALLFSQKFGCIKKTNWKCLKYFGLAGGKNSEINMKWEVPGAAVAQSVGTRRVAGSNPVWTKV